MKICKRIFALIVGILLIVNIVNINRCFAINTNIIDPGDYNPGKLDISNTDSLKYKKKIGSALGAIRNVTVIASVIVLMSIGLKYMLGSVEEKANYKQTLVPYVIGCIVAMSGTTLVSFIYNVIY